MLTFPGICLNLRQEDYNSQSWLLTGLFHIGIFPFRKQTFLISMGNIIFLSTNISSSSPSLINTGKLVIIQDKKKISIETSIFLSLPSFFCAAPMGFSPDLLSKTCDPQRIFVRFFSLDTKVIRDLHLLKGLLGYCYSGLKDEPHRFLDLSSWIVYVNRCFCRCG